MRCRLEDHRGRAAHGPGRSRPPRRRRGAVHAAVFMIVAAAGLAVLAFAVDAIAIHTAQAEMRAATDASALAAARVLVDDRFLISDPRAWSSALGDAEVEATTYALANTLAGWGSVEGDPIDVEFEAIAPGIAEPATAARGPGLRRRVGDVRGAGREPGIAGHPGRGEVRFGAERGRRLGPAGRGGDDRGLGPGVRDGPDAPRRVALAELGPAVPELALLLDASPVRSVADLVERSEHADVEMLRRAMLSHAGSVDLLLQKPQDRRATRPGPVAMRRLLTLLRVSYGVTIPDLGHDIGDGAIDALRLSESAVLVSRLDVPGVRLSRRLLDDLAAGGVPGAKIRVAFNQYGRRVELGAVSAGRTLGREASAWLSDEPAIVNASRNRGVPMIEVAGRSRLARRSASCWRACRRSLDEGGRPMETGQSARE